MVSISCGVTVPISISCGVTVPMEFVDEVLNAKQIGINLMTQFLKERLETDAPRYL